MPNHYNIRSGIPQSHALNQKSIFSYNVYRTSNQQRAWSKSGSINFQTNCSSSTKTKDPEVLYVNKTLFTPKPPKNIVRECSTQTSKTILQLATEEKQSNEQNRCVQEVVNEAPVSEQTRQQCQPHMANNTREAYPFQPNTNYQISNVPNPSSYGVFTFQPGNKNLSQSANEYQGNAHKIANVESIAQNGCGKEFVNEIANDQTRQQCQAHVPNNTHPFQPNTNYEVFPFQPGNNNVYQSANQYQGNAHNVANVESIAQNVKESVNEIPNGQIRQQCQAHVPNNNHPFQPNTNYYFANAPNQTAYEMFTVKPSQACPRKQDNQNLYKSGGFCNTSFHQNQFDSTTGDTNFEIPTATNVPVGQIKAPSNGDPASSFNYTITPKNFSCIQPNSRNRSTSPMRIGFQIEILNATDEQEPENGQMSPDSLAGSPRNINDSVENCPYSVIENLSDFTLTGSCQEQDYLFSNQTTLEQPLTKTFLHKNRSRVDKLRSRSCIDSYPHPNYIEDKSDSRKLLRPIKTRNSTTLSLDLPDNSFEKLKPSGYNPTSTFMCPTTASQIKSNMPDIRNANLLLPSMRRGKSTSPKPSSDRRRFECSKKIPYIDQSKSDISSSMTVINATRNPEIMKIVDLEDGSSKSEGSIRFSDDGLSLLSNIEQSNSSFNDANISVALTKLHEMDWRLALKGLAEIVEICRVVDADVIYDHMSTVNQRVIQLLRSPRSHVCRVACQATGHLFEYVKDTRRPLFDEIVDILLHKTADANKFIRHDANMALDCMVTHIPAFNAIRALCSKGPSHKNALVRSATARLLVCSVVLAGQDSILHPNNNEYTRKRIIQTMAMFLEDKNLETRKLAERLYKVLSKDTRFDVYMKKYLGNDKVTKIKRTLRFIHKK